MTHLAKLRTKETISSKLFSMFCIGDDDDNTRVAMGQPLVC